MSGPTWLARIIIPAAFCQEVNNIMVATPIQPTTTVNFRVSGSKPSPVQVFVKGGRKWIVASEVCRILGMRTDSVAQLVPEQDRSRATVLTKGSVQSVTTITEAGFTLLVARSTKPAAKALREWMLGEVLPSIPKPAAPKVPVGQGDFF
jgi:prophage antirepressor-like protein